MSAFATLTPHNALAKLAFDDICRLLLNQRQDCRVPAMYRMVLDHTQIFDEDVARLRRQRERRISGNASASDTETITSSPEPDPEMDKQQQEGDKIWTGHFALSLDHEPYEPGKGYLVGKGSLGTEFDILLCSRHFAKDYDVDLRNPHARFNFFPSNRGLYIISGSGSGSAQLTVNGDTVRRHPYALNQHSMKIMFDRLAYTFQWTDHAETKVFESKRHKYVITHLDGPAFVDVEMPTPMPNGRTIGNWTLGHPLGAGAMGKVVCATNTRGQVAAIKMIDRTLQNADAVDMEIETFRKVTELAATHDKDGRILRLLEVLRHNKEESSLSGGFDPISVVMAPMTPRTFVNITMNADEVLGEEFANSRTDSDPTAIPISVAEMFRDALKGLQVMHAHGWMHRDLKPSNIGLFGTPPRAVLLDFGASIQLPAFQMLTPTPGCVGTLGWMAPELELINYDHSVDIWAMGVLLYCLTYNHHPWEYYPNPWRPGAENEAMRPYFSQSYNMAILRMQVDYAKQCFTPKDGYIHPNPIPI
ncbi:kinase-like domain-containing protein [Xylaria sp. FL0043]|nr:kinase-like domain-containing protein [Xylaria sp. FL0043]